MKKIAFISFNTGGTLGHVTLLSRLANSIIDISYIHILSEQEYKKHSSLKDPRIKWNKFKKQKHLRSNGGQISHKSIDEISEYLFEKSIDFAVYSTFFDSDLVKVSSQRNIKNIYISYPLRDTYSELFFLRKNNELFDEIIILNDLYDNDYSNSVIRTNPIFLSSNKPKKNSQKILLTCGGGGRPSSERFLKIIESFISKIKNISNAEITLIRGPNNKDSRIKGINEISSTNNMQKYIDDAKIVISEAGYYTTHELISRTKPSILIPGERRIDNQELRAIKYEKEGLGYCFMAEEKIDDLILKSLELLNNEERYEQFQENNLKYFSQFKPENNIEAILRGLLK